MFMGQQAIQSNQNVHPQVYSIPLWWYKKDQQSWIQIQPNGNQSKKIIEEFRVVTYNIWFSEKYQPMRFNSLCQILNQSNAQIIGLQEMTPFVLQQLLQEPFIQERYYVSDVDGRTFNGWYGVVLFIDIHLPILHLNLVDFPRSSMGRRLIYADIQLNENERLRIGTVHLESLNSEQERHQQLNIIQNTFHTSPATYILMGDFNFSAHGGENTRHFRILSKWIDVWANLKGSNNPGYTFDIQTNSMTRANSDASEPSRIDRIILQSETYLPIDIEILGMKNIGQDGKFSIYPSDHYGLTAIFRMKR